LCNVRIVVVSSFLVFVDTGIRTGTDVLKALALGAQGVFIGRPILYGLACGGHDGVRRVLDILKRELTYDMACCGITSIDQINKDILYKHG
jgi:isopentenyl diphosphate isomerase/L-lactate dehydrogenase-like FMN-dependent dehydrogenase